MKKKMYKVVLLEGQSKSSKELHGFIFYKETEEEIYNLFFG